MIVTRRNRGRMAFFLLLLSGHFATAQLISGVAENTSLDCTNDLNEMFCQFKAPNCSENRLTILKYEEEYDCPLHQCDGEQCCCSVKISPIVLGQTYTGTVRRQNQTLESKHINVTDSFKPRTPTIKSVNESDGNFEVGWMTNMDGITSESLRAEVTYYKKGSTEKISKLVTPAKNNGLHSYEINGQHLDAGVTYVVCVRSFTNINDKFSDCSKEWEFKTPSSLNTLLLWVAIVLSVCAVIISASLNGCYVKLKSKWSDQLPSPKVTVLHFKKPPILLPEKISISCPTLNMIPCIPRTDGFKPIKLAHGRSPIIRLKPNLDPYKDFASVLQTSPAEDQSSSGSSSIFNQTYSLLIPNSSDQKKGDGSSSQRQSETLSVSADSSNKSDSKTDFDQLDCMFPDKNCTFLLPTQFPSQRYKARRLTAASSSSDEPKHSSSVSSRELENVVVNEPPSEAPACSTDTILNTGKLFFCNVPAGSHGFSPMDDNYQPFQCQVEGVSSTSGVTEVPNDRNKHLNQDSESFVRILPKFISFVDNGMLYEIPVLSKNGPIKVISDYHSV